MTDPRGPAPTASDLARAEKWLANNGLPYFSDSIRAKVRARIAWGRLTAVALACLVGSALLGWWATSAVVNPSDVGGFEQLVSVGVIGGSIFQVLVLMYALVALRSFSIARWAARRTFASLGLLFPLATRALPMLLLFMTFLFINTEVWMVAAKLTVSIMIQVVVMFLLVAAAFLFGRLPEEVDGIERTLSDEVVSGSCVGTPLAAWSRLDTQPGIDEPIRGLERANLVLVLLISQLIQVLLLACAVFAFFVIFGFITMDPEVIKAWLTHPPTPMFGSDRLSTELIKVSAFLSAFAGLYFTVYAVTDAHYREHFFAAIVSQMQRAVSLREVYRAMVRASRD